MTNTDIADAKEPSRKDVYTKVTERIISDLAQGIRPWMKPWSARVMHSKQRWLELLWRPEDANHDPRIVWKDGAHEKSRIP